MRYALDATPLLGRRTGIGRCVARLVEGLIPRLGEEDSLVLYATPFGRNRWTGVPLDPLRCLAEAGSVEVSLHWVPYPLLRPLWNRFDRPSLDRILGPIDAFLGTNYRLPPVTAPRIATIYDVALLEEPGLAPARIARRFHATVTAAARRAHRIVTISERARDEIRRRLDVPIDRIEVIRPGVDERFRPSADVAVDRLHLWERYGIDDDFVLFVGTSDPRKNLDRLLSAIARCQGERGFPRRLVLIGQAGFGEATVRERLRELDLSKHVVTPGFVPDEDLPRLLSCARLLAFPSLIEGFGLPIVEAMACGCPVVTSNTSCLPEVAGDAAELVDPRDVDSIAAGLHRVATDPSRTGELVRRGFERAKHFTWERYVGHHLELLREISAAPRGHQLARAIRPTRFLQTIPHGTKVRSSGREQE